MKPSFRSAALLLTLTVLISLIMPVHAATLNVPCDVTALISAISGASSGDTLDLAAGCTYTLTNVLNHAGLPDISITLIINGNDATIERSSAGGTPQFRLIYIAASGHLTINNLQLNNGSPESLFDGGAVYSAGTLILNMSTVSGSSAFNAKGGGIYNSGSLTLNTSTVSGNFASNGGGIFNGNLFQADNSTISDNRASTNGGGIDNGSGTTTLSSTTVVSNDADGCGAGIFNQDTVTMTNSTFSDNVAIDAGGGLCNEAGTMTLTSSTISGNQAFDGAAGGILNIATLTITNSAIEDNLATPDEGGGIVNFGTLTLKSSTVSGNQSVSDGAGLWNGATLNVSNSTISGNSTGNFGNGGGIYNRADLTVTNSTVSDNSAGTKSQGGGIFNDALYTGTVKLGSDIIAANSAPTGPDLTGAITSLGYNVIGDTTGATFSTDPTDLTDAAAFPLNLSPLANNGGFTQTMALGDGSVALGAGNCSTLASITPVTTDQRGVLRKSPCDVGAFEVGKVPVPGIASAAPASDLCGEVTKLSKGAIIAYGGVQNVELNREYGNTYCRLIAYDGSYVTSPAEIGVRSVIDLGVLQAVDVFGELPNGDTVVPFVTPLTICLRGTGDVLFLSAADAGRTPQHLAATSEGDYHCVSVPNSGTVVLVGSPSNLPQQPVDNSPTSLDNCQVTTLHSPLNLRAEPNTSAPVIDKLPYNLTLTATEHVSGWYRVIYLDEQGWVSDQFVSTAGNCG